MNELTIILERAAQGDRRAADELLPLVYEQLRCLAANHLRRERAGQTLQPTALVHEAYLRLLKDQDITWDGEAHFYAAAAEAMRRILIERARRRQRIRHGGGQQRVEFAQTLRLDFATDPSDVLAVHEAMDKLHQLDPRLCELVKLRCVLDLTIAEAAKALNVTPRTLNRDWVVAKAWLRKELGAGQAVDEAVSPES